MRVGASVCNSDVIWSRMAELFARPLRKLMDSTKYQAAIESLKKTMEQFSGGHDNTEARSAAQSCLMEIKIAAGDMSLDGYFSGEVHKIEGYVGELFSPRKHQKYRDGSKSGVEELRRRVDASIRRLQSYPSMFAKGLPDERPVA